MLSKTKTIVVVGFHRDGTSVSVPAHVPPRHGGMPPPAAVRVQRGSLMSLAGRYVGDYHQPEPEYARCAANVIN